MRWIVIAVILFFSPICQAEDINWDKLTTAIIQVESGGNPNAYNKSSGAIGLMQIIPNGALAEWNKYNTKFPPYAPSSVDCNNAESVLLMEHFQNKYRKLDISDLYNSETNIKVGEWYIQRIFNHYLEGQTYATCFEERKAFIFTGGYTPEYYVDIKNFSEIITKEDFQIALICAAYNGGIHRLKRNGYDINKMPKETLEYVKKILRIYNEKD